MGESIHAPPIASISLSDQTRCAFSINRTNADHSMLTEDKHTAAQSSDAIRQVVLAVRAGTGLTGTEH